MGRGVSGMMTEWAEESVGGRVRGWRSEWHPVYILTPALALPYLC